MNQSIGDSLSFRQHSQHEENRKTHTHNNIRKKNRSTKV